MPRTDGLKKAQAARIYKATQNVSETARKVGVHRVTLQRWVKEPGFLDLAVETVTGTSLDDLVPKAMHVLDSALEGQKVTQAQIRAALEVVKASNALKSAEPQGQSLAEVIAKLDAEGLNESD